MDHIRIFEKSEKYRILSIFFFDAGRRINFRVKLFQNFFFDRKLKNVVDKFFISALDQKLQLQT